MSIAVNDLTEKRHFADALGDEASDFVNDFVYRAAALDAAAERNDAECTGVATAVDDRHVGSDCGLTVHPQALDGLAGDGQLLIVLQGCGGRPTVLVRCA